MRNRRFRPIVERLEQRQLLSASTWFDDSGQGLGTNALGAEFGDLDGDGDVDLFAGCGSWAGGPRCSESQVWLNDGSGQFSKGWSGGTPSVSSVALGDLDDDGDLDAFLAKGNPIGFRPDNEVWLNDGQGNLEDSGQRLPGGSRDVRLGDVDGDGDFDAVTGGIAGTPSQVWLNDGAGKFTNSRQRLAPNCGSFAVALGDVDGDGDLDAWFGCGDSGDGVPSPVNWLYLNDGQGKFIDSGQRLNPISTSDVHFGDLDGDGDLDAYLANGYQRGGNHSDRVYMNDGTGTFTDSGQRLGRSNGRSVGLGDVDGDGDLDAVVANGTTLDAVKGQANEIWLNNGSGVFTLAQELGDTATTSVALSDIDGDGDLDAFFANLGQDNQIWINTQLIAGDANRDGVFNQLDIVQILQSAKYQTGQPASWTEGDFNGDTFFDQLDIVAALQTGKYGQA